ncbi:DUF4124 domain-containing protein [Tahibacter harae]|uniref:DUF4124 domain-containing protein n=1 Tax=Tahibacter harae TaxID=2963937 RepID=A0ABT1QW48_9GAMM|nr:DUF4124 domain-containing protein [Tahibacter harae]MCQ4166514.1 DUF4124 domain-containing protein [Tahibacter harae]
MLRLLLVTALVLAFAGLAAPVTAATVYKCTDGEGNIAYQNTFCATHENARVMRFAPAPKPGSAAPVAESRTGKSKARGKPAGNRGRAASRASRSRGQRATAAAAPAEDQSWECRLGNGEVFYQHAPCPGGAYASHDETHSATRGRRKSGLQLTPVSSKPISRAEACRRIHAPSASSRPGHERDEDVSTYERNLGRDPCR